MISTVLAENPTLARVLLGVAVVVTALLGALLVRRRRVLLTLAVVGLLGVLALMLSPSGGRSGTFCTVQLSVPFRGLDTLANIALTVPLALFAALWARRPLLVLGAVSGLSALVELTQAVAPALGRACDTDDWFMNTIGAGLGAALAGLVLAVRVAPRPEKRVRRPAPLP